MSTKELSTTPTKSRTRTAILQAALRVLTTDRSAALSAVANQADVARSTLHRYFPERSDLTTALTEYATARVDELAEKSRLGEGTALEALTRVALEYFENWESVMWMYAENWADSSSPESSQLDLDIAARIAEGQADGSIDDSLPADWFQHTLFAIVYSAWEYERNGNPHAQAALMVMMTMKKVAAPLPTIPPIIGEP